MNSRFISTHEHPTRNPRYSQTYTVNFYNTRITTVVTSTAAVAYNWVYNLRKNRNDTLVGLGVLWRPTFCHYLSTAATLQLCVGTNCLIFQLNHADSVPATLRKLLVDDRVTFVGVHNGRDRSLLIETRDRLTVNNLVDLATAEAFGNRSMEEICGDVLGFRGIVKPREIGLSNWDEFWLSDDQVQYACVDAYVAYSLGVALGYPKYDRYACGDYGYATSDSDDDQY